MLINVYSPETGEKCTEIGTLFPQYSSKRLLGIPKEASFWRADKLALHQSTAQPNLGGRAAEK